MLSSAYRALTLLFASLLVLACVMISSSAEVESDRPFRATNAEDTSLKSSAMMHEIVLPAGRLVLAWIIMSVVFQVRRIFALDYQIPELVQKLLPKMQGYAMEDTTVDLKNKKLTAVGHNCSFSKICRSREVITYEQDPDDPSKTIYTQRMSYSISGLGAVFGRRLEKAATDFSAKKAQAGEAVMSKRIDSLAATDWRNDTSSWKQNIVAMLNLAVLQGRLTAVQASEQLRAAQTRLMSGVRGVISLDVGDDDDVKPFG
ncbi:Slowmo [Perkinsus olseni]|uniref:Slowmo n=1 Tax=Perkinsus olseni TaxID=32597 RepID=A0A7J6LDI0_PEROL|nr:Slowmo [Perkinsus olseni]